MITLDIPRSTPSQNEVHHKHWKASFDQRKLWEHEIWCARVRACPSPVEPPQRARVTLTRYGRILDVTNFFGGLKGPIDALKLQGLIVDDDEAHMELVAKQIKGVPRTVIVIEACSTVKNESEKTYEK